MSKDRGSPQDQIDHLRGRLACTAEALAQIVAAIDNLGTKGPAGVAAQLAANMRERLGRLAGTEAEKAGFEREVLRLEGISQSRNPQQGGPPES